MNARYEAWMDKAEDDLQFAEIGLREGFHAQVCFLSQQSIEKSLKGALVFLGKAYPKTHSLRELSSLFSELNLRKWKEMLSVIDGYYIPLRYPDAAPGMKASGPPNKQEAKEALSTAQEIFEAVTEYISKKK
ncbi:MAG: hypothetical protein A3I05_08465 [Deltaproteobacteria bacterium RIFCSPLOWO2_02_FULL_44_10]|nr:MAG: hypothetical protein A3C46_05510 [Deltaproteobacteria bacterium RIFCSPHIGHO2_02_FULL_44_16]OGQ45517.1 MAG: hypothetical protein A3I05_08465 [Deltaproteobacteria bacterium RIFCSPLOWO2_02_FULL_44_10]